MKKLKDKFKADATNFLGKEKMFRTAFCEYNDCTCMGIDVEQSLSAPTYSKDRMLKSCHQTNKVTYQR